MKKSIFYVLLIISFSVILSGCWNYKEINELSFAIALGIDKDNDDFKATIQIINPSQIASQFQSTSPKISTFNASGKTLFEALRQLTLTVPRRIFYAHLRVLVLGEEFTKEGIKEALDLLSRNAEIRSDFYVLIVKEDKAASLLNITTPIEEITANNIFNSLENSERLFAQTSTVDLTDLLNCLSSESKSAVLTGIRILGDPEKGKDIENIEKVEPSTRIEIGTIGVFKEDKLAGWLNEDESKGFSYVKGTVQSTITNIPCQEDQMKFMGIESTNTKSKFTGKVINGKPKVEINVDILGVIADVECKIDLTKVENIRKIESQVEENIEEIIGTVIKKVQKEYKSDIFGFGEAIHRADFKTWKTMKEEWNTHFDKLETEITVKVKIKDTDTITNPFFFKKR